MLHTQLDHRKVVNDSSPHTAARARITTQRADRLREFILGHLPDGVTVDVVISAGIQTAAVLPTEIDAIFSSEATEIERAQAEQFLAGVDADYLVFVTGNEADLTRIPLNDQLTADHAHQFGLVFHELLHILKTAITAIGELLESEIDAEYHPQVHDLINIVEDGAIESEAIHGDNFSDNAGIRLELTRRLHSQTPEDIPRGEEVRYSFWDAVTSCLYDEAIYPTGTTEVLLDEDDDRIQFKSDADRDAFEAIHSELCNLSEDALAIRSAERSDTTHSHDKTASIRRARCVIETWKTHIQPVLDDSKEQDENQEQGQAGQQGDGEENRTDEAAGQSESVSDPNEDGDIFGRNESPQNAVSDAGTIGETQSGEGQSTTSESKPDLPEDFDSNDVSLSREATSDPHQNIFEQPRVTPDPDPDDVDYKLGEGSDSETPPNANVGDIDDTGDSERQEETASEQDPNTGPDSEAEAGVESEAQAGNDAGEGDDQGEHSSKPSSRAKAIAQAAERARQREQEQNQSQGAGVPDTTASPGLDEETGGEPPQSAASSSINRNDRCDNQLTLGSFGSDETVGDEGDGSDSAASSDSVAEIEQTETATSESGDGNSNGATGNENDPTTDPDDHVPEPDGPEGPAHAQISTRSPEEEQAAYEDALASDERAAHDEADRESIDQQALEEELSALADQLERSAHDQAQAQSEENSGQPGGSRGKPGRLDELNLLPISDDLASPREWAAIEDGADRVADTLDMYLRLDRRKSVRRGLSAGAYDTRAGHRLTIGDSRVCKSRTLGNEKQYALVLILDRSGSMRQGSPPKIEVATRALTRFALAAENLGIRVAIIDFIHREARLVKPFSVETRHVQASLLDTSCGGGTPLADALGLARELIEIQRDEPLIITVTDDQPADTDAVIEQIRRSHAPVCSLTIATDYEPGDLSADATELARYYERQETVYTPDRLDDRLDQFASLLAGL